MKTLKAKARRAFTLVEIMIAVAIFAAVMIAIYSSWSAILRGKRIGQDAAAAAQRSRVAVRALENSLMSLQMFVANIKYDYFSADTSGDFATLSFVARLPKSFPRSGRFGDLNVRRVTFAVESGHDSKRQLVLRQTPLLMDPDKDKDEQENPLVLARACYFPPNEPGNSPDSADPPGDDGPEARAGVFDSVEDLRRVRGQAQLGVKGLRGDVAGIGRPLDAAASQRVGGLEDGAHEQRPYTAAAVRVRHVQLLQVERPGGADGRPQERVCCEASHLIAVPGQQRVGGRRAREDRFVDLADAPVEWLGLGRAVEAAQVPQQRSDGRGVPRLGRRYRDHGPKLYQAGRPDPAGRCPGGSSSLGDLPGPARRR